jgi:hypothetical protein
MNPALGRVFQADGRKDAVVVATRRTVGKRSANEALVTEEGNDSSRK